MESGRHESSASSAGTYRNLSGKAHEPPGSGTCKLIASLEKAPVPCRSRCSFLRSRGFGQLGEIVAIVEARNGVRHVAATG
jgi:hypothetical protein